MFKLSFTFSSDTLDKDDLNKIQIEDPGITAGCWIFYSMGDSSHAFSQVGGGKFPNSQKLDTFTFFWYNCTILKNFQEWIKTLVSTTINLTEYEIC